MVVHRYGLGPATSKVDVIAQLVTLTSMAQLRTFHGTNGYPRQLVPNYTSVVAPLTDLFRNKRFAQEA